MSDFTLSLPPLPHTADAVKVIAWCLSAREGRPAAITPAALMGPMDTTDHIAEFISTLAYVGAVLAETGAEALSLATERSVTPDDILMAIVNRAAQSSGAWGDS